MARGRHLQGFANYFILFFGFVWPGEKKNSQKIVQCVLCVYKLRSISQKNMRQVSQKKWLF